MKKCFAVFAVVLLFSMVAAAQDTPRMETFLGYTYVRASSATDVPSFSANGGGGQFVYNFNKWIGAVADVGAVHNGNIDGFNLDTTFVNFLFGPRVSIRKWSLFTPYAQVLWGGVHAAGSTRFDAIPLPFGAVAGDTIVVDPNQVITARVTASETAFAMTAGGGLDIKINKHLQFRPIGLDYYMTRLRNLRAPGDNNQNNLRYTAGFNFTFGAQ
jgi:opacity protein-like surface antigen